MGDENSWRSRRLLSYGLLSIVVTHIMVHAGNIGTPLFPLLKAEFNLTNQQIGLISAIPLFCQLLISIPAGVLSDRYGAKKLIALSVAMGAAGAFLASVSANPWMYIVAMTLLTLNTTIYHPSAISHTAGMVSPSDRSRVMGIFNGGGTFGVSLGPLSVTILMGVFALSWRQTYQFWVIPILLSLAFIILLKSGPQEGQIETVNEPEPEPDEATSLLTRNMAMYLTSVGVRRFAGSMTTGFLSIWLVETQGWDISMMGLIFGLSSLMGIVAAPLGGELASRIGDKRFVVLTEFASYTCFLCAILVGGYLPFMAFYLAQRFFGILAMPADTSITARLSPRRQRGLGIALSFMPPSLMGTIAPLFSAYVADTVGLYPIFLIASAVYFVGLAVFQFGVKIK